MRGAAEQKDADQQGRARYQLHVSRRVLPRI
jgi:hypothetical protein